jgi:hypothetical protein
VPPNRLLSFVMDNSGRVNIFDARVLQWRTDGRSDAIGA